MSEILEPISQAEINHIKAIPYLQNSIYRDLDIAATLDFFVRRYVRPLSKLFDISQASVIDCGAGYGWFSFAYLLAGGKEAVAADVDPLRLQAGTEISHILGIKQKMSFIHAPIQDLPLNKDEVDIFVSIETLEHVGKTNIRPALVRIRDVASQGILITTPNKLFPAIAHDTRLPIAHWLPASIRQPYAKLFGRQNMNANNDFLSPLDVRVFMDKFRPISSCLTFQDFASFKAHYPFYLPYDIPNRWQHHPGILKSAYYKGASMLLGRFSYWVMPSLSRIFVRK